MAVIRFEVVNIKKEWDGNTCDFEAKVVSVHTFLFSPLTLFRASKEMKIGQEFQHTNNKNISILKI